MTETTYTDKSVDRIRNIHDGNFLNYLSSAYEVLKKIFSYLSIEDLETVSNVFEGWRTVVETTKKERTNIESFVLYPETEALDVWSVASFSIAFILLNSEEEDIQAKLNKHLAKNAQVLVVESRAGVIGTSSNFSSLIQQPNSNTSKPLHSAGFPTVYLRIPVIPGVGIKTFTWKKNISFKEFRENFTLPENQIIKCLLILITVEDNYVESGNQKDDFILYLKKKQTEDFAVGGCLVDFFLAGPNNENTDDITKYIVFYGDKVEAASTVLKENVVTKKGIDLAVEELKEMSPKTNKGILFVFRCYDRNIVSRRTKDRKCITEWEGNSLVKHFPTTPIIGCFGYGEIGKKFPDNGESLSKRNIWEYSYSTSVVYVGFKN